MERLRARSCLVDGEAIACQTEESKLQAFDATISAHRNTLKEELLRR
jgi:hypothetical protein